MPVGFDTWDAAAAVVDEDHEDGQSTCRTFGHGGGQEGIVGVAAVVE